jgi:hypothetical protein
MTPVTRLLDSDRALFEALLESLDRIVAILDAMREVLVVAERDQALELAVSISRLEYVVGETRDDVDAITDAVGVSGVTRQRDASPVDVVGEAAQRSVTHVCKAGSDGGEDFAHLHGPHDDVRGRVGHRWLADLEHLRRALGLALGFKDDHRDPATVLWRQPVAGLGAE